MGTLTTIKCGKCTNTHQSVAAVRACHEGAEIGACTWLIELRDRYGPIRDEDGQQIIRDCAAETIFTETGWSCADGHSYVDMETRHRQGWDYAEDAQEAESMMRNSTTEPRDLVTGGAFQW